MRSFILSLSVGVVALGLLGVLTPDAQAQRFRRRAAYVPVDTYYIPSGDVVVFGPAGTRSFYYMPQANVVTPAAAATPAQAAEAAKAAAATPAPAAAATPDATTTATSAPIMTPAYEPMRFRGRRGGYYARRGYWR
jgi:hypothetical protein